MKNKIHFVLLAAGAVLLAIGVFFFGRICAVKDSIYADYNLSFSDASFQQVFINDHDEATVKADFDAAILAAAKSGATTEDEAGMEVPAEEAPAEGAEAAEAAEPAAEATEATEEAQEEALEAISETSPYDTVIGSFSRVSSR